MKCFIQKSTKENPPMAGWYNTDGGELFWFGKESVWSCREDRISEEYPNVWYQQVLIKPQFESNLWVNSVDKLPIDNLCYICKVNNERLILTYNTHNKFWVTLTGKTHKPFEVEKWLNV